MILPYRDYQPQVGKGGWVAPNATLIGDVMLGEDVSLWYNTVVRGDVHAIRIGARTNIQDSTIVHITQHEGRRAAARTATRPSSAARSPWATG